MFFVVVVFPRPANEMQTSTTAAEEEREQAATKAGDKKFSNGKRNSSIIMLTVIQTRFKYGRIVLINTYFKQT